jgi:hypothetical protein
VIRWLTRRIEDRVRREERSKLAVFFRRQAYLARSRFSQFRAKDEVARAFLDVAEELEAAAEDGSEIL